MKTMATNDLSVILTTYNRALVLKETMEAMAQLDVTGLRVQFVVVDNNSSDATRETVSAFMERLPLIYMFEARPGKNCALNRALRECELGDIVVFTDDDVTPAENWLRAIYDSSSRWPGNSVFGGKIVAELPGQSLPRWAESRWVQGLVFSAHDPQAEEGPYAKHILPFGPNMWVRRCVIDSGVVFNELVGPRPTNRIMGSETEFLLQLSKMGEKAIYVPSSVVVHRLAASQVTLKSLYVRSYRWGRSLVHLIGPWRENLAGGRPMLWRCLCISRCAYAAGLMLLSCIKPVSTRFDSRIRAIGMWAESVESWRQLVQRGKL